MTMKNMNFRVLLSLVCVASILAGFSKVSAGPVRFDQVVQIVNARPGQASTGTFSRLAVAGDYSSILVNDGKDDTDDAKKKQQQDRVIVETKSELTEDTTYDCVEEVVVNRGFPKWALLGLAAIPIGFILIRRHNDTPTPTPTTTPPGGGISVLAAPCTPATGNVTRVQFIGQLLGLTFLLDGAPVVPDAGGFVTVAPGPHTYAVLRDGVVIASGDVFVPDCNGTPTPTPTITPTPTMTTTPTPTFTPTPTPTPTMTPTPTTTPTPPMTPTPTPPEPVPEPMTILLFGTGLASIGLAARRKFGARSEKEEKEDE